MRALRLRLRLQIRPRRVQNHLVDLQFARAAVRLSRQAAGGGVALRERLGASPGLELLARLPEGQHDVRVAPTVNQSTHRVDGSSPLLTPGCRIVTGRSHPDHGALARLRAPTRPQRCRHTILSGSGRIQDAISKEDLYERSEADPDPA